MPALNSEVYTCAISLIGYTQHCYLAERLMLVIILDLTMGVANG